MKKSFFIPLSLIALTLASCGHSGGSMNATALNDQINKGKDLASLGDAKVHEGYLELLARVNPNIEGQLKTPAGKKRLVDSLLEQELLFTEGQKRGIDKLPQVQEKAALYQRVIFAQAILDDEVEKKSKEYYGANKDKEFARVEAAHILIRIAPPPPVMGKDGKPIGTPPNMEALDAEALKKAKEAKAKLDAGTPWQEVVDTYSDDKATKAKGGEIGQLSRGDRRVSRLDWNALVEAAFKMKAGEVSEPIKAKDGYHIVKLLKEATVAPFEEVANSIKFKLRSQVKNELLASLTKGKATDYKDEELKNASQAPAPGAMNPAMGGTQVIQTPSGPQVIKTKPDQGTTTALGNPPPPSSGKPAESNPASKEPQKETPKMVQPPPGGQIIQTPSGPQVIKTKTTVSPESKPSGK